MGAGTVDGGWLMVESYRTTEQQDYGTTGQRTTGPMSRTANLEP